MDRSRSGKIIKYLSLTAFVFLTYVFQGMILNNLEILDTTPLLLPLTAVVIAMFEGSVCGAAMGLVCGIFCDLSFNQPTVVFTLLLTIIGAALGILCKEVLETSLGSCILCSAVTLALSAGVQMFYYLIYMHAPVSSLLEVALIQSAYSIIFAIPIYFICRMIHRITQNR